MNTTREQTRVSPAALVALLGGDMENFVAAMTPGGIEAQEKRGQMEQVEKLTLPIDLMGQQKSFEKAGFVFGNKIDHLFQEAAFPKGWSKKPTEHDMWTDILDEHGHKRGAIFYKAAFYDRCAHASLSRRFGVAVDYDSERLDCYVHDERGVIVKRTPGFGKPDWSKHEEALAVCAKRDAECDKLRAWLDEIYPEWQDVNAYWN